MRSCTLLLTAAMLAFAMPVLADESPAPAAQAAVAPAPPTVADVPVAESAPPVAPAAPAPGTDAAIAATSAIAGTPEMAPPISAQPSVGLDQDVDLLAIEVESAAIAEPTSGSGFELLAEPMSATAGAERTSAQASAIGTLGPEAVDEHGHSGRIHTVAKRDTLWDISAAYLGTPWVWPSIWQDNGEITDPNLIVPGERIWISAGEMRKVTQDQADSMIAAEAPIEVETAAPPAGISEEIGSTEQAWEAPEDALMAAEEVEATDLEVAEPLEASSGADTGLSIRITEREAMGFISEREMDAATSLLDSEQARVWLAQGDLVALGLGEGRVEVGDEFTVFRDATPVRDVEGGRLLGFHVDILGWMVVRRVEGESAVAEVRMSNSEMRRGDLAIPRIILPVEVGIRTTPEGIDGQIVFLPNSRTTMGGGDHVYLNRGSLHGFEVGSHVEVFTPGRLTRDRATGARVMTPDRIDAQVVLVEVKPSTSVGFVVRAARELSRGGHIRPASRTVASR